MKIGELTRSAKVANMAYFLLMLIFSGILLNDHIF